LIEAGNNSVPQDLVTGDARGTQVAADWQNLESPETYVGFERASSEPAETVTIYYDSYRNLLARGIIPQTPAPARRPSPNPFPGFVADPPA